MFFLLSFYQPNCDYQSYARLMTADLFLKNRLEQQLLNLEMAGKVAQINGDTILIHRLAESATCRRRKTKGL